MLYRPNCCSILLTFRALGKLALRLVSAFLPPHSCTHHQGAHINLDLRAAAKGSYQQLPPRVCRAVGADYLENI